MAGKWADRVKNLFKQTPLATETHGDDFDNEGLHYSNRVRSKLAALVEDFAQGRVNRAQFEVLYAHYQKERDAVEKLIASQPSSDAWRMAMTEGQSVMIRRRLGSRVLGYAVYADEDPTPLRVYGEFAELDAKQLASLLDYLDEKKSLITVTNFDQKATCLCIVPGELATLFVLFSTEPARIQIQLLQDLHQHFERANYRVLARSFYKPGDLVFPFAAAFE
jgi:hypothetical protein